MGRKKSIHYIDNARFQELLVFHKEIEETMFLVEQKIEAEMDMLKDKETILLLRRLERKKTRIRNELGKIFMKICQRYITKPNLINYSWDRKDEMISDACFYMTKYVRSYKVTKKNPFSYFTQVCKNAFLQNINKYKKMGEKVQSLGYIENLLWKNSQGSAEEWE